MRGGECNYLKGINVYSVQLKRGGGAECNYVQCIVKKGRRGWKGNYVQCTVKGEIQDCVQLRE